MTPDFSYSLPFELDRDVALRIYLRRWLKVLRWGVYSLAVSVLILLLRFIPFSFISLALVVFLFYGNPFGSSKPPKPKDSESSDDDDGTVFIVRLEDGRRISIFEGRSKGDKK